MKLQTNTFALVAGIILLAALHPVSASKCVTETGKPVDWYIALRIPNSRTYLIYDSATTSFRSTDEGLLGAAVDVLSLTKDKLIIWNDHTFFRFEWNSDQLEVLLFIDQPVDKSVSTNKAHSATLLRILGFVHYETGKGGMLYVHSIPNFIDSTNDVLKKTTRETSSYAQSIVCVSLDTEAQAKSAIEQNYLADPYVYENTFGIEKTVKPTTNTQISSLPYGFTYITKTSISPEHPFEETLANHFKTGWMVNTWSRPYKESDCSGKYPISNIIYKELGGVVMKSSQDHSKWALSYGSKQRVVCIGDMNHMDSQAKRGGSFVCREDPVLYRTLYQTILDDECEFVKNCLIVC